MIEIIWGRLAKKMVKLQEQDCRLIASFLIRTTNFCYAEMRRWEYTANTIQNDNLTQVGTTTLLSHYLTLSKLVDSKTKRMWRESSRKLHDNVPKIFQITKENRNIRWDYQLSSASIALCGFMSNFLRKLAESSVSISVVRHPFER